MAYIDIIVFSYLNQEILFPISKDLFSSFNQKSSPFPKAIFPFPCIFHPLNLQNSIPILFAFRIAAFITISIAPFKLSVSIKIAPLKRPFVFISIEKIQFSLAVKFSRFKISIINCPIFQSQLSSPLKVIINKGSLISQLIFGQNTFNSLPCLKSTLKINLIIARLPLFAFAMNISFKEFPIKALRTCDQSSFPMGEIMLKKSIIIKLIRIQLSITFLFDFHYLTPIMKICRHG